MSNTQHFSTFTVIPMLEDISIDEARNLFFSYKNQGIVKYGLFDDDLWILSDEYANKRFDFVIENYTAFGKVIGVTETEYKSYMKAFLVFNLGTLALTALQSILHAMKHCFFTNNMTENLLKLSQQWTIHYLSEFFSLFSNKDDEIAYQEFLEKVEDAEDMANVAMCSGKQRCLANFESYFRFNDILDDYWNNTTDEEEKLFFFPVWFWWHISAIIPMRPREVCLTPRKCLKTVNGDTHLIVRKNKIKGSNKTKSYKIEKDYKTVSYAIPENIEKEIRWYLEKTESCSNTELNTLFTTEPHYHMWERVTPHNSRYFTYINYKTCLRYFYDLIIKERYGYDVIDITDRMTHSLQENEIERIHLGDTRHLAMINMISEGATPVVAMLLAGHDNIETSAHYFSNITELIECKTYRQFKKQLKGKQQYRISQTYSPLSVKEFTILEDGSRCYSPKLLNMDFADCYKVAGPAGEIGFCKNCPHHREKDKPFNDNKEYYQNEINKEFELLQGIVKKIRQEKGEEEELGTVLLRIKDDCYSYAQYCMEKLEGDSKWQESE